MYRGSTPGGETFLVQLGDVTTYLDDTCGVLRQCYYRVSATNDAGEGPPSNELFATWPDGSSRG